MTDSTMERYDVAVVGGGPAGLSAALILLRARRRVVVIDAGEPRNARSTRLHGFLGRDGDSPADFLARGRAEIRQYGGVFIEGVAVDARPQDQGFKVTLGDGRELSAGQLMVTTGLHDELPSVPGVSERWGVDVVHCPMCHGWEARDERVGVLAVNAMAVDMAMTLKQWAPDIRLFSNSYEPTREQHAALAARGVSVVPGTVAGLDIQDDRLVGLTMANGRSVPCSVLFVTPSAIANDDLLVKLGAEVQSSPPMGSRVVTDRIGRTCVPGVWAAGNVTDPSAQVIIAAGDAARAASALNGLMIREEIAGATALGE
ncbi:NAD(P)/FAD-dependent oxidoreductase [Stackebrandtia soli]|uniref:NAD(P)/FAD-dependent oxidoreductase n=1 Tax=Stackebrandtia soli TaxID=1892856 RepID=UPI0039E835E4